MTKGLDKQTVETILSGYEIPFTTPKAFEYREGKVIEGGHPLTPKERLKGEFERFTAQAVQEALLAYKDRLVREIEEEFDYKFNHFNSQYIGNIPSGNGRQICDEVCENDYTLEDVKKWLIAKIR